MRAGPARPCGVAISVLLAAVALAVLGACRTAGVMILDARAESGAEPGGAEPGGAEPGGHAQLRLLEEVADGEVIVDGQLVAILRAPTTAVVVHRLPPGRHEIVVVSRGGEAQGAVVEVRAGLAAARAVPRRWSAAHRDAVSRPEHLELPPEGPPRPCSRFGVVAHLYMGAGLRLCQRIGWHITLEAMAGTFVTHVGAEVGITVHIGETDWLPYVALRRGGFLALVGSGRYLAPAIGWRFGVHFLEIGPAFLEYQPRNGERRDLVGAFFLFGWD
jgi:hypothetical protein